MTNVSGHGGNNSSPNYVWEGLSLLPMSSLLDRVDEIVINGILFEDNVERKLLKFPVEISEPGVSMESAVRGELMLTLFSSSGNKAIYHLNIHIFTCTF